MKIYFQRHVLERMEERLITVDEVVNAVTKGSYFFEGSFGKEIKYSSVYKGVRVVLYESKSSGKVRVVTVTPSKLKNKDLHREKAEKNISIRKILENEKGITSKTIRTEIRKHNLYYKPLVV